MMVNAKVYKSREYNDYLMWCENHNMRPHAYMIKLLHYITTTDSDPIDTIEQLRKDQRLYKEYIEDLIHEQTTYWRMKYHAL